MHTSIGLKFGKHVGQPKVNISIKFCENPTKILVVINDYLHKQRSICSLAYRLNHHLKIGMYLDSTTSEGSHLVVRNEWSKRQQRYVNQLRNRFLRYTNTRVSASIRQATWSNQLKFAVIIHYPL